MQHSVSDMIQLEVDLGVAKWVKGSVMHNYAHCPWVYSERKEFALPRANSFL